MTQAGIDSKVIDSSMLESIGWSDGAALGGAVNPRNRIEGPVSLPLDDWA